MSTKRTRLYASMASILLFPDLTKSISKASRPDSAGLDRLQDQLIIFMALAEGTSTLTCGPPELHTRTAAVIAEKLTHARFEFKQPDSDKMCTITCHGAALHRSGRLG